VGADVQIKLRHEVLRLLWTWCGGLCLEFHLTLLDLVVSIATTATTKVTCHGAILQTTRHASLLFGQKIIRCCDVVVLIHL
jgi:hypothetical protein